MKSRAFSFILVTLIFFLNGFMAFAADEKISPQIAWEKIKHGALLLDVRSPGEYKDGHLEGALNIPFDDIEKRASELGTDRNREIVLHCKSGRRAEVAKGTLAKLGFSHVFNAGGYEDLLNQSH